MQNVVIYKNSPMFIWGKEPYTLSPLHIVYMYTEYLFTREGGGGKVEPESR